MRIANILRKVLRRLVPNNSVEKALGVDICESGVMQNAIELWHNMYKNEPPWRGGKDNVIPLNLPSAISEEFARLILTEFSMEVTGSPMAAFINEQLKDQLTDLNKFVEMYCEGGAIAVKPFVTNIDENGRPTAIELDFVKAVDFFPCAFNNKGEITAAVFVEGKKIGDYLYTRLEYHELTGMTYTIINKAFKSEEIYQYNDDGTYAVRDRFRKEVPLSEVDEWAGLSEEPVIIGNIDKPLFAYIKVPKANNIDTDSPLGVSVFSRATEIIEQADIQYGRVLWEYKATEAAILGDSELFQTDKHGKPVLPAGQERMFKTFDFDNADGTNKGLLKEYAPQIRHEALFQGLNKQLMKIEFLVGLAYGTLSEPTDIEKTAYEIRVSKQRSYHTVTAMQDAWHKGFKKIIYAMRVLALLYDMVPDGETELNCNWGDGVLEDTEAEYQRRWSMVVAGKLKTEAFLAWYFGCSEEEAKNMMPEPVARFPTEE